jgi:deazaflavin-dependent oxidoreductase (nitroreductase family)
MTGQHGRSRVEPKAGKASTLPAQAPLNRVVRAVLHLPVVSRVAGRRLVIVYAVGRKSGRRYAVPVAYTRHAGELLVSSQFPWLRNLRSGEPVAIRLAGRRLLADVRVFTDETDVVEHLALMVRDNRQFAKFNGIALDRDGEGVPEDLHLAWAAGSRVAVLAPR